MNNESIFIKGLLVVFLFNFAFANSQNEEIIEKKDIIYKYENLQKKYKKATKDKYIDITAGLWYLTWEQEDTPDNSDIDYVLKHKFDIKNSFAKEIALTGKYKYIKANIKYLTSEGEEVSKKKTKVQKLLGTFLFYNRNADSIFRYIYSNTDGNAKGFDEKTNNTSYIEFNTKVTILDLIFYPQFLVKKYVGVGLKYLRYELPQSFYIINNHNVISRMIEPSMEWKGTFLTLEITNLRKILNNIEKGSGNKFHIFGDLKLGYSFAINTTGKTIDTSGNSKYLKGDKGYFTEADFGILYFSKIFSKNIYLKGGYRYSIYVMETEKDKDDLYIYAKAKSTFFGPYLNISIMF